MIMGVPLYGNVIDHVNGDGLDNRKVNLRIVSKRMNALNSNRTFTALGIERHGNRWRVRPFINGLRVNLGSFASYEEAVETRRKYLVS
jgi:hypothetical protein